MAIAQTERRGSRQYHSREWPKPIQCASSRCRSGPQACFRAGARRLHSAATSDLVRYSRESSFSRLGETPPYPASGQHLRQPVEEPDPKLDRRCFIVRDHNGQVLACVYFEEEPGRRATAWSAMFLANLAGGRFNASSTIPVHGADPWVIVETPTRHHPRRRGRPIPRRLLLVWSERVRISSTVAGAHLRWLGSHARGDPPKATSTAREDFDAAEQGSTRGASRLGFSLLPVCRVASR